MKNPRSTSKPNDPEAARQYCLRLLSGRPRTKAELGDAMRRKGFEEEVVAEILDRYAEVGMIDDEVFARAWVDSRHRVRGLSKRALAGELRRKGVDAEFVDAAVEAVSDEDERAAALELARRRYRNLAGQEPDAVLRKLVGMLARKGYGAGVAIPVVKQVLAEADEGAAELLDEEAHYE
ncbi:recombination regulator RecX [Glycomyces sp. L485]|uniref:regulatory protein RecX n=1 Tax=Glycomyces sp. L485 TaxID=2909235 RepID=UPI001F4B3183|nr:regulatory protein RecX [Glycomyces sp. L485]MCH7231830.1 recombination regulator RecX [Glycomyces sp. L485]